MYYFAYGQLMNQTRMYQELFRNPECRKATMKDTTLDFVGNFVPTPTLTKSEGSRVYGTVYKIEKNELSKIKSALREQYLHKEVRVEVKIKGKTIKAVTHIVWQIPNKYPQADRTPTVNQYNEIKEAYTQIGWDAKLAEYAFKEALSRYYRW